jgi:hypothetical protein
MHSSSPHSCFMPCPSHPPLLDHSNYIWRRVPSYEASYYAVFSKPLSLRLSSVQIFSFSSFRGKLHVQELRENWRCKEEFCSDASEMYVQTKCRKMACAVWWNNLCNGPNFVHVTFESLSWVRAFDCHYSVVVQILKHFQKIITCWWVHMTIITGSKSDNWISWHFGYSLS